MSIVPASPLFLGGIYSPQAGTALRITALVLLAAALLGWKIARDAEAAAADAA